MPFAHQWNVRMNLWTMARFISLPLAWDGLWATERYCNDNPEPQPYHARPDGLALRRTTDPSDPGVVSHRLFHGRPCHRSGLLANRRRAVGDVLRLADHGSPHRFR